MRWILYKNLKRKLTLGCTHPKLKLAFQIQENYWIVWVCIQNKRNDQVKSSDCFLNFKTR